MEKFEAATYKDQKGDFNKVDEEQLIDLLHQTRPKRILDVGCGDGLLIQRIQKALPESTIVAIDNSAEQIALARREASSISFELASITSYTSSEKFDAIFSFYAFPHMPKSLLSEALRSVRALLAGGGAVYLFTNICLFDTATASPEDQEACDIVFLNNWRGQINLISLEEMKGLCTDAGFKIRNDQRLETGAKIKNYGDMVSWLFVLN